MNSNCWVFYIYEVTAGWNFLNENASPLNNALNTYTQVKRTKSMPTENICIESFIRITTA